MAIPSPPLTITATVEGGPPSTPTGVLALQIGPMIFLLITLTAELNDQLVQRDVKGGERIHAGIFRDGHLARGA